MTKTNKKLRSQLAAKSLPLPTPGLSNSSKLAHPSMSLLIASAFVGSLLTSPLAEAKKNKCERIFTDKSNKEQVTETLVIPTISAVATQASRDNWKNEAKEMSKLSESEMERYIVKTSKQYLNNRHVALERAKVILKETFTEADSVIDAWVESVRNIYVRLPGESGGSQTPPILAFGGAAGGGKSSIPVMLWKLIGAADRIFILETESGQVEYNYLQFRMAADQRFRGKDFLPTLILHEEIQKTKSMTDLSAHREVVMKRFDPETGREFTETVIVNEIEQREKSLIPFWQATGNGVAHPAYAKKPSGWISELRRLSGAIDSLKSELSVIDQQTNGKIRLIS